MFCKLFETTDYGQILVVLDQDKNDTDYPAITISFQPPGLGVCSCKLGTNLDVDPDECWETFEESLASFTEEQAIRLVAKQYDMFKLLPEGDDDAEQ